MNPFLYPHVTNLINNNSQSTYDLLARRRDSLCSFAGRNKVPKQCPNCVVIPFYPS